MTQAASYITPELKARVGAKETRVSLPVTLNDIRKWAIAIYWPETPPREFWDEEYAKQTRWGGIVAPQEFNPFAWSLHPNPTLLTGGGRRGPNGEFLKAEGPRRGGTFNASDEAEYFQPIRPGDVITGMGGLKEVYEKTGGRTGLMLFEVTENRWTNQRGELVALHRGTMIHY